MGTTSEQSPFKKEHSYVILDHQNPASRPQTVQDEFVDEEKIEIQSHPSEESISHKPKVGLLSKSRFSDLTLKLSSALLYGTCSFLITVINKIVLTTYKFPSSNILAVGQMIAILIILKTASQFRVVTIRRISMRNRKLWGLAAIYLGNIMAGLGSTKHLPLPMLIALRRFSIAMTAVGEFYLLNIKQTFSIMMTIVAMIGGSFIAAASDLTFNATGYLLVMVNNFFTAANVVYIKKTIDSREINKHEILFYNALLTIVPLILISYCFNNMSTLYDYEHWSDLGFIVSFLTSCVMGYLLMFSTVLCTHYNTPLTTTIVGTLKVSSLIFLDRFNPIISLTPLTDDCSFTIGLRMYSLRMWECISEETISTALLTSSDSIYLSLGVWFTPILRSRTNLALRNKQSKVDNHTPELKYYQISQKHN